MYLQVAILVATLVYLQIVLGYAFCKALLKAAHHEEGGEDKVGEEGDEVSQLSIRLGMRTVMTRFEMALSTIHLHPLDK